MTDNKNNKKTDNKNDKKIDRKAKPSEVEPRTSERMDIRTIARAAANDNYRIRTIILGIVRSDPFTLRRTPET